MSSLLNSPHHQQSDKPAYISKVVLIGDSGVGKTALARRFVYRENTIIHYITIGVDFMIKEIDIDTPTNTSGDLMRFHIWDTAGQERFRTVSTMYYKDTTCFILMFALDNINSFQYLVEELYPEVVRLSNPRSQIILVGNKKDKYQIRNPIIDKRIQRWYESCSIPYFETEMNDMNSIQKLFLHIGKQVFNDAATYGGDLPGFRDTNQTFRRIQLKHSDEDDNDKRLRNKKWYRLCDCCINDIEKDKWY
jgi:Ras-related protein Rab-1A